MIARALKTDELIEELKSRAIDSPEEWTKNNLDKVWWSESDANGRRTITLMMPKGE